VVHPEDRQAVIDATQAHIDNGVPYEVEYRITNTKQQVRWMRSVGRIDETKSHYFRGIIHDITERKMAEEQIKQLAFYDSLTQLPNRRLLHERLHQSIEQGRREGLQQAVLMLDLDRFKAVNDSFGHKAGDELLQQVAERISEQLRKVDTVARLGGDEFVVLLVNIKHSEDVERVAFAIITELSQPFLLRKTDTVNIGTSIGISFYPQHGDSPEILMDIADAALYQAKEQGRGCFCIAP
jgi:diguanylate cyclase (GGDEF)-like protein